MAELEEHAWHLRGEKWKSRETTNLATSSETTARGQALREPLLLPTSILQAWETHRRRYSTGRMHYQRPHQYWGRDFYFPSKNPGWNAASTAETKVDTSASNDTGQEPLILPEHWGALEKGVSKNNAGITLLEQHICFCLVLPVQPHGHSPTPHSQHTHITCTVPQGSSSHAHPKRDRNTFPHATAVQLQYMATGTCRAHRKSPQKGFV